jgi:hypothetical protein
MLLGEESIKGATFGAGRYGKINFLLRGLIKISYNKGLTNGELLL